MVPVTRVLRFLAASLRTLYKEKEPQLEFAARFQVCQMSPQLGFSEIGPGMFGGVSLKVWWSYVGADTAVLGWGLGGWT